MESDSNSTKVGFWRWALQEAGSNLEPIGKFIGTYALAVFLVVYYAVWIYPSIQSERRSWIEEITNLRNEIKNDQLVLDDAQAESVLALTTDAYYLALGDLIAREFSSPPTDCDTESCAYKFGEVTRFASDDPVIDELVSVLPVDGDEAKIKLKVHLGSNIGLQLVLTGASQPGVQDELRKIATAMDQSLYKSKGEFAMRLADFRERYRGVTRSLGRLSHRMRTLDELWDSMMRHDQTEKGHASGYVELLRYQQFQKTIWALRQKLPEEYRALLSGIPQLSGIPPRSPAEAARRVSRMKEAFRDIIATYMKSGVMSDDEINQVCGAACAPEEGTDAAPASVEGLGKA